MKKEFSSCPKTVKEKEMYGFSWMEHVMAIPSPLIVVTSYKSNGKPNATMQSWSTFVGEEGYFCILGSVNKNGHMYSSIKENKDLVINFPSDDIYDKCLDTIKNNNFDNDEITLSGLTVEKSTKVNAPRIKECFLNLECKFLWEKEIVENSNHVVMCVKIVNVCMDEEHYNFNKKGRYGKTGYLYNVHSPLNPETGENDKTYIGIIEKHRSY